MSDHSVVSNVHKEMCMRYLLGELDAAESANFEMDLQASSQLSDELLRQADVIAGLGTEVSHCGIPAEMAPASHARFLAPFMVIAASLLLVFVFSRSGGTPGVAKTTSEELLIAKAWVAQRHEDTSGELNLDLDDSSFGEPTIALDNEDTLSWMFVAVASNPEDLDGGDFNDG